VKISICFFVGVNPPSKLSAFFNESIHRCQGKQCPSTDKVLGIGSAETIKIEIQEYKP
jgi:hypothetical protein